MLGRQAHALDCESKLALLGSCKRFVSIQKECAGVKHFIIEKELVDARVDFVVISHFSCVVAVKNILTDIVADTAQRRYEIVIGPKRRASLHLYGGKKV